MQGPVRGGGGLNKYRALNTRLIETLHGADWVFSAIVALYQYKLAASVVWSGILAVVGIV